MLIKPYELCQIKRDQTEKKEALMFHILYANSTKSLTVNINILSDSPLADLSANTFVLKA